MFNVSVIIPVYNAANYIRRAAESVTSHQHVGEIILIDDAYPDNALEICKQLAEQHEKVKLLQHPNGENRGPGASRNLGIQAAACEYVAFLDADDWYLPNRFDVAKELFESGPDIDGVYDATGFYYEATGKESDELTTLPAGIRPEELLFVLVHGNSGYFHTNAITLRKSVFERSGLFDETLKLHQDTHLWIRLAYAGKLVPGSLTKAVAIRRVHDQNRITHKSKTSRNLLYQKTFCWFENKDHIDKRAFRLMFIRYISTFADSRTMRFMKAMEFLASHPRILTKLI